MYSFTNFVYDSGANKVCECVDLSEPQLDGKVDDYYLPSMLGSFLGSEGPTLEVLDAYPVVSLSRRKTDPFYNISLKRLQNFVRTPKKEEQDTDISNTIKQLFMLCHLTEEKKLKAMSKRLRVNLQKLLKTCMKAGEPQFIRDCSDAKNLFCKPEDLMAHVSLVPTEHYNQMVILPCWITGAIHYRNGSILFRAAYLYCMDVEVSPSIEVCQLIETKTAALVGSKDVDPTQVPHNVFGFHYANELESGSAPAWLRAVYVAKRDFWNFEFCLGPFYNPYQATAETSACYLNTIYSHLVQVFSCATLKTLFTGVMHGASTLFNPMDASYFYYYRNNNTFDGRIHNLSNNWTSISTYTAIGFIGTEMTHPNTTILRIVDARTGQQYSMYLQPGHIYIVPDWFDFYIEGTSMRQFLIFKFEEKQSGNNSKFSIEHFFIDAKTDALHANKFRLGFPSFEIYDEYCKYLTTSDYHDDICITKFQSGVVALPSVLEDYWYKQLPMLCKTDDRNFSYFERGGFLYFHVDNALGITNAERSVILTLLYMNRFSPHVPCIYPSTNRCVHLNMLFCSQAYDQFDMIMGYDFNIFEKCRPKILDFTVHKNGGVVINVDHSDLMTNCALKLKLQAQKCKCCNFVHREFCTYISRKPGCTESLREIMSCIEAVTPKKNIVRAPANFLETCDKLEIHQYWSEVCPQLWYDEEDDEFDDYEDWGRDGCYFDSSSSSSDSYFSDSDSNNLTDEF